MNPKNSRLGKLALTGRHLFIYWLDLYSILSLFAQGSVIFNQWLNVKSTQPADPGKGSWFSQLKLDVPLRVIQNYVALSCPAQSMHMLNILLSLTKWGQLLKEEWAQGIGGSMAIAFLKTRDNLSKTPILGGKMTAETNRCWRIFLGTHPNVWSQHSFSKTSNRMWTPSQKSKKEENVLLY